MPQVTKNRTAVAVKPDKHDQPFVFGVLPCTRAPGLFSPLQLARLMIFRSRIQAGLLLGVPATQPWHRTL